ncbi:hypothetical protein Cni_G06175 [Canna indica]|uniref:Uncharacterized protein n=1 Tax=Canna indica TaxID=4628 RepID=A0AAQ3JWJ0_9LILI|nr:hypothetical protein Cni_G06175 [Canna indica]
MKTTGSTTARRETSDYVWGIGPKFKAPLLRKKGNLVVKPDEALHPNLELDEVLHPNLTFLLIPTGQ